MQTGEIAERNLSNTELDALVQNAGRIITENALQEPSAALARECNEYIDFGRYLKTMVDRSRILSSEDRAALFSAIDRCTSEISSDPYPDAQEKIQGGRGKGKVGILAGYYMNIYSLTNEIRGDKAEDIEDLEKALSQARRAAALCAANNVILGVNQVPTEGMIAVDAAIRKFLSYRNPPLPTKFIDDCRVLLSLRMNIQDRQYRDQIVAYKRIGKAFRSIETALTSLLPDDIADAPTIPQIAAVAAIPAQAQSYEISPQHEGINDDLMGTITECLAKWDMPEEERNKISGELQTRLGGLSEVTLEKFYELLVVAITQNQRIKNFFSINNIDCLTYREHENNTMLILLQRSTERSVHVADVGAVIIGVANAPISADEIMQGNTGLEGEESNKRLIAIMDRLSEFFPRMGHILAVKNTYPELAWGNFLEAIGVNQYIRRHRTK